MKTADCNNNWGRILMKRLDSDDRASQSKTPYLWTGQGEDRLGNLACSRSRGTLISSASDAKGQIEPNETSV